MKQSATIAAIYDALVAAYVARDTGARRAYFNAVELEELPRDRRRVLDLGCGVGRVASVLSASTEVYCGIDLALNMASTARQRHGGSGRYFLRGDALALPFADRTFDLVVSLGLYEYVAELALHFAEARRVLALGGDFLFTCHTFRGAAMGNARNDGYTRIGHGADDIIAAATRAGFAVQSVRPTFRLPPRVVSVALRLTGKMGAHLLGNFDRIAPARRARGFVVSAR